MPPRSTREPLYGWSAVENKEAEALSAKSGKKVGCAYVGRNKRGRRQKPVKAKTK